MVAAVLVIWYSASYRYAGLSPGFASVQAILEHVVPYCNIPDTGLLVPVIAVALEKDSRAWHVEMIVLYHYFPSRTDEKATGTVVSEHTTCYCHIRVGRDVRKHILLLEAFRKGFCKCYHGEIIVVFID